MKSDELLQRLTRPAAAPVPQDMLPTGSVSLDILLGGGWPMGAVSEISGPPGYADPVAYRTIAAVQAAFPDRTVILCCNSFSVQLARSCRLDKNRLLVTSVPDHAVSAAGKLDPGLAVVDRPLAAEMPVRADKSLSMLYLTASPGDVRSDACIQLRNHGGARSWLWAERMWHSRPYKRVFASMPVCSGPSAFTQELLDTAALLGIVTVRGRWYKYGTWQIAGGWEAAVRELDSLPDLRMEILAGIAGRAAVYPGWERAYAGK